MANLTDLLNEDLQSLQRVNWSRVGLKIDPNAKNSLTSIKEAIRRQYEEAVKKSKKAGPYEARCLHAYIDPTGQVPAMGRYCQSATTRPIIKVIAKPTSAPIFDALPTPCITDLEALKEEGALPDRIIFAMHPVFYSDSDNDLPKPGDLIQVDFDDRQNMVFGRYLKIIERGPGLTQNNCISADLLFKDPENTVDSVGG